MAREELKLLSILCQLSLLSSFITVGESKIFQITSNMTMQRRWDSNLKDGVEEKGLVSQLDDVLRSYSRSLSKDEVNQSSGSMEKMEISHLKDVYINTCDTQVMLQNVNYTDFNAFQSSPVEVETKIGEVSNYRTLQIDCSIKTNVMTFSGDMIFQDSNYSFAVSLTNPAFRVEKNISGKVNFDFSISSERRLESFTYKEVAINIHPKDMHSVALKKNELKNSILQRLADSWLLDIADFFNKLIDPKILQHQQLLTKDTNKKLFIKNICNLLRQLNETKVSSLDSHYNFTLKGLSNFDECEGDVMVVKKIVPSPRNTNLQHNSSILLTYNHSNLLITKEMINAPTTSTPYESPSTANWRNSRRYSWEAYATEISTPEPQKDESCTEVYVKHIQATFAFEGTTLFIGSFSQINFDFIINESLTKGCSYSSMMDRIKSPLKKELRDYINKSAFALILSSL